MTTFKTVKDCYRLGRLWKAGDVVPVADGEKLPAYILPAEMADDYLRQLRAAKFAGLLRPALPVYTPPSAAPAAAPPPSAAPAAAPPPSAAPAAAPPPETNTEGNVPGAESEASAVVESDAPLRLKLETPPEQKPRRKA